MFLNGSFSMLDNVFFKEYKYTKHLKLLLQEFVFDATQVKETFLILYRTIFGRNADNK